MRPKFSGYPKPISRRQVIKTLKEKGWTNNKGDWSTTKRGLKLHTKHGLTLHEAASLEGLRCSERL